jgi:hypothetical protein
VVRRALALIPIVVTSAASITPGLVALVGGRLFKHRGLDRHGSFAAG